MGGRGSGTWFRFEARETIDQMLRLDIRNLKKRSMLSTGRYLISWSQNNDEICARAAIQVLAGKGMVVSCKWQSDTTGLWHDMERGVRFARTACSYGGFRQWFVCPRCSRRLAVLVINPPHVVCRHCLDLSYACQNEHAMYRALRRRNKIGDRIGGSNPFDSSSGTRPKGMHWKTFNRLQREYEIADELSETIFLDRYY